MRRIAQVAPPLARVPPRDNDGMERVIAELSDELVRRGHEVTLFASGDMETLASVAATEPVAMGASGLGGGRVRALARTVRAVLRRAGEFDVIHSHLGWAGLVLRAGGRPLVTTFHGPVGRVSAIGPLQLREAGAFVALSRAHAELGPWIPWSAVIPNGLSLGAMPFSRDGGDDLCFVGGTDDEKGLLDAIEVARLTGCRLRVAARIGMLPEGRRRFEAVVGPVFEHADVEYLGELDDRERRGLVASSLATLVCTQRPEPFGRLAIESLACGTPVLACPPGALPEIVRDGVDGFLRHTPAELAAAVALVPGLDRAAIRASAIARFGVGRMTDAYEALYATLLSQHATEPGSNPRGPGTWRRPRPMRARPHGATTELAAPRVPRPRHPTEVSA